MREKLDAAWLLRRTDTGRALELAQALRDDAAAVDDPIGLGRALTIVGACHIDRNDFLAALRSLLEARALLEGGPPEDVARVAVEAGYLDVLLGEPASGIESLLEAHQLYQQLGDPVGQAATLNRIGVAFYDNGQLDDAQHAYERSLALHTDLRTDLQTDLKTGRDADDGVATRAGLHNNLAKVLTDRGEYEAALERLAAARRGFEEVGERRGLGMTLHNAAVVSERQGATGRAIDQLRESIELYTAAGHTHGACEARTRLGVLLAQAGDDLEADSLIQQAYRDARDLGIDRECARAAEALAELHESRERPADALVWLKILRTIERRLFDSASDRRLRAMQVRYQLERFEHDSVTDALTGLANRRGLDRALVRCVKRARASDEAVTLALFDLDDFKQINDRFSHAVGDEVLRRVAALLRARSRPGDVCARFGGEEFVILLPGCDVDEACRVADGLRRAVRDHDWDQIAQGLVVTTSGGVASLDDVPDRAALLAAAADRALYAAKGAGKDRVHGP